MATTLNETGTAVVGYFADGHAAHRAINALVDKGFAPSEIGAAFHVSPDGSIRQGASTQRHANVGGGLREELGTTQSGTSTVGGTTSFGGAASDSTEVQPNVLGNGSGTAFGGAGLPGPIPGSSLANSGLPSELKSSLPHDGDPGTERTGSHVNTTDESLGRPHTLASHETWRGKLRHLFGREEVPVKSSGSLGKEVADDSKKFGTGEGDLHLNAAPSGHRYSHAAFESSFNNYGVAAGHSRHLASRLGEGGAVVTVHASGRTEEAERLLEQHGGEVRVTDGSTAGVAGGEGLVEVFGTVERDYPGYVK